MARTDNLSADGMKDIIRRLTNLERATPMNNASIGRNGLRVHSGGVITIQNGGLEITGTAEVIGQLIGSGTITWTGPINLDGATTVDGPMTINGTTRVEGQFFVDGPVDINGLLDIFGDTAIAGDLTINGDTTINGATALRDNLTVGTGGKITVNNMTIGPTSSGGGLDFTNGGTVAAEGSSVAMYLGTGYVGASNAYATLTFGGNSVSVNSTGVHTGGDVFIHSLPTTSNAPNLYADGSGKLYRCV